jgi:hypothetical protein
MQTGTCFRVSVRLVLLIFATVMAGNLALAQVVITPSKPAVVNPGGTFKFAANVPVAWSMLPGSKGTIDSDGTYHAPANATAQQSVGGCQLLPNDHIINTRIDNLPVNANSSTWLGASFLAGINYTDATTMPINYADNSTPTQNVVFQYTPANNGPFTFPVWPNGKLQNGWFDALSLDAHEYTVNPATCAINEIYAYFTDSRPYNSIAGIKYNSLDYALPGAATDAGGMTMLPLILRLQEWKNAVAAGGTINHALRVAMRGGAIQNLVTLWPATTPDYTGGGIIPFGARFRLKSSFDISSYDAYTQVLLKQLQQYGLILDDTGFGSWAISAEKTKYPFEYSNALAVMSNIPFTAANFEAVDESSLEVSAISGATTSCECVVATGAAGKSMQRVILQAVTIGLPQNQLYIQAATPAKQLYAFVNGTSNTGVTWTMSPSLGTVTSGGLYTPPATVSGSSATTITATSNANPSAVATMAVVILPAGPIRIDMAGPCASGLTVIASPSYNCSTAPFIDSHGNVWQAETGDDGGGVNNCGNGPWPTIPDIQLYKVSYAASGDMRFDLTVPNGTYTITGKFGNSCPYNSSVGSQVFNLEAQGKIYYSNVDVTAAAGGPFKPRDYTLSGVPVSNGQLSFVIRFVKGSVGTMISALEIDPDTTTTAPSVTPPTGLSIQIK